jgi:hypothetical protein
MVLLSSPARPSRGQRARQGWTYGGTLQRVARDLEPVCTGQLNLTKPGLLVFEPTGDEVLLQEVRDGPHKVAIYRNGYPTSHLVVISDG